MAEASAETTSEVREFEFKNADEMGTFLTDVRDKLVDGTAAPIYALTVLNDFLQHPKIYDFLTQQNKELARDIWLRVKQAGFQIKNPPMLFDEKDVAPAADR